MDTRIAALLNAALGIRKILLFIAITLIWQIGFASEKGAQSLNRNELMAVAFPGWKKAGGEFTGKYSPSEIVEVNLPEPKGSPTLFTTEEQKSPDMEASDVGMTPLDVVRLDDNHAVLITISTEVDEAGETACGYQCSYFVGAYFFTLNSGEWRLSKKVDAAVWTAYWSGASVQRWPEHGFVYSIKTGGCWQGYCSDDLVLLGLQPDRVLPLLTIPIDQDSSGSTVDTETEDNEEIDCRDLLDAHYKAKPTVRFSQDTNCLSTKGESSFNGGFVYFDFNGVIRKVNKRGHLMPLTHWSSRVTFKLEGDSLKLIDGKLPEFAVF